MYHNSLVVDVMNADFIRVGETYEVNSADCLSLKVWCSYVSKRLTWEFSPDGMRRKMTFFWDDIVALRASVQDERGLVEMRVNSTPLCTALNNEGFWEPKNFCPALSTESIFCFGLDADSVRHLHVNFKRVDYLRELIESEFPRPYPPYVRDPPSGFKYPTSPALKGFRLLQFICSVRCGLIWWRMLMFFVFVSVFLCCETFLFLVVLRMVLFLVVFGSAFGGFGRFIINNRPIIPFPFDTPHSDTVIFIGDWYTRNHPDLRKDLDAGKDLGMPDGVLINGNGPYRYNDTLVPDGIDCETIEVQPGAFLEDIYLEFPTLCP